VENSARFPRFSHFRHTWVLYVYIKLARRSFAESFARKRERERERERERKDDDDDDELFDKDDDDENNECFVDDDEK